MVLKKSKKPGVIPGFLFLFFCSFFGWKFATHGLSRQNFQSVCYFVSERIFLPEEKILPWQKSCLHRTKLLPATTPLKSVIEAFNDRFSILRTSHLVMYSAVEAEKLWSGQAQDTGIESQYVDGELVILKVHSKSPAAKAGLKFGDIILQINDETADPAQAETAAGIYKIGRKGQSVNVSVEIGAFVRDEAPEIKELPGSIGLLRIPSFRAEFFEKAQWMARAHELEKFRFIILDLRGNLGGNFVAGLRVLSSLLCQPTVIGSLAKPKSTLAIESTLPDEISDELQIEVVDRSRKVSLSTFGQYGCIHSELAVLVDSSTASTAEMTAQALRELRHSKVYGSVTAGQLLVGVWYPMPEVGPGVKLSIPEAIYKSQAGHAIEGPGVAVDEVLYYHLNDLQNGQDSWIQTVSKQNVLK